MNARRDIHPLATGIIHAVFILFSLFCIIPLVTVVSISLTSDQEIGQYGYRLIPHTIDFTAYRVLFSKPDQILQAYGVTILITVVGTFFALLICAMLGYAISRRDYAYRRQITFFIFITMLFGGGLVPWYILIAKYLHMKDTIFALIIPNLLTPWYVFLLRTFFQRLPMALVEAAKIEGASELRIFLTLVIPLSKPALATIGLLLSLHYWNDWWLALLFIDGNQSIIPLQFLLYQTMSNIAFISSHVEQFSQLAKIEFPTESARMAIVVLAAGPMLFVFPFFQKYFVKGLTIGSLKE